MFKTKKRLAVFIACFSLVLSSALLVFATEYALYDYTVTNEVATAYEYYTIEDDTPSRGLWAVIRDALNIQDLQDFINSERTIRDFRNFLRTDLGNLLIFIVAGTAFLVFCSIYLKKANFSLKVLTYSGSAMALAFILSFITIISMPQGGSVTPMSMFVVSLIGFWFGPTIGLVSGVTYGLLQLIQGAHMVHPVQLLLDYPLAFGMLGLSGFFRKVPHGMYIGFIAGTLGRFIMSTIAGWLYWIGVDTPGSLWASIVYNSSYIFPEIALTLVVLAIPAMRNALKHVNTRVAAETTRQNNS